MEGYTFEPTICGRSKQMAREGYVEDRLIAGWAENLLMREEQARLPLHHLVAFVTFVTFVANSPPAAPFIRAVTPQCLVTPRCTR